MADLNAGLLNGKYLVPDTVTTEKLATNIALKGTPTATTAPEETNTTQIATTAFVTRVIATIRAALSLKQNLLAWRTEVIPFVSSQTNYDLPHVAMGGSIRVQTENGPVLVETRDYTVALTGGAGGKTRITLQGSILTILDPGEAININYAYER